MVEGFQNKSMRIEHGWRPSGRRELIILDNRDSFVFNLAHRFDEVGCRPAVVRSDEIELEELRRLAPAGLIISPGPGHPDEAGISVEAIRYFSQKIPILGVCLGHQAIAVAYGGRVEAGGRPVHGMASAIDHEGEGLFEGLPPGFDAARYHSLVVSDWPDCLVPTARADGFVMALQHRRQPVYGVQFHPESVLTTVGKELLANFCARVES